MALIEAADKNLQSEFDDLWSRLLHDQAEGKKHFTIDSRDLLIVVKALIDMQEQIRVLKQR